MNIIVAAEKHFAVSVPDERAERSETVEQFAKVLFELRAEVAKPLPYEVVLADLRKIVAKKLYIPIEQVTPRAHFVNDLRIDQ